MATLKANGGVYRYLDKDGSRIAVCLNHQILRQIAGDWKRWKVGAEMTLEQIVANLEAKGFTVDTSTRALGTQQRTREDAHWHKQAINRRRLDRQAGLY